MTDLRKALVLLFFIPVTALAQQCEIRNLVFEGAGIRGIAYAGVIATLEEQKMLGNLQKVGGTSAGAITALMLSLNYSSDAIAGIVSATEFRKFNDGRFIFFGGFARMNKRYGWYRGEKFTDWLSEIIEKKTGNPDITFAQLHQHGFKDLYVTGTCLNKQQLIVFSRETYPNMKVKDAVRISMSIPLYFTAVLIDSTGRVYTKPEAGKELDVMVDGGITGNFPIFIFDETRINAAGRPERIPNCNTIGVRIDSDSQIEKDTAGRELTPLPIQNFNDYMAAFYSYVIENLNRHELTAADWKRTISVSSVGISPRIRKMSVAQKASLTESGRSFTAKYLAAHGFILNNKP